MNMEFISNSYNTNHKDTILTIIEWAEECYFCTSFLDKEGLEIVLPSFEKGILDRQLKVQIFSNGQNKWSIGEWSIVVHRTPAAQKLSLLKSESEISLLIGTRVVFYTSEYITEEPDAVVPHVRICVRSA
jgi:hypothetical protein